MKTYRDFVSDLPLRPAIIAHRGAWHLAPENSVASILRAAEAGYEVVEIDVQCCADGVLFLMHDEALTRMTGHEVAAQSLSWAELSTLALRAGDGQGDAGPTAHRIPTLQEALVAAHGRIYLDVDVKSPEQNMEAAGAAIAAAGMQDYVDIKVPLHSDADAERLAALEAQYGVMVMPMTRFTADTVARHIARLARTGARIVETEFDALSTITDNRAAFEAAGLTLWVNTLTPVAQCGLTDAAALTDPDGIWGALMEAGVTVFQTDEPEALAAWRAARG
ncbi:glycerophosphodiester phosphodiesterase family protein [Pseudooceanicola marinus]|uniref:glycerophosphodiester phosphodiesterase family protein n=1 Tax=Pseudooceanicola marinus TaxID=396013 RepID=UPI001CD2D835|nr:glycerophosphodiester phosphodiesterase family protein [Pseudooceanicola marinus]MCA1334629.1 glycerophosphodiester phosphodiesterase family protein [Pseudooceanicola marinus]